MAKLIIASQNKHKILEFKELLNHLSFEILSLDDVSLGDLSIEENGKTFADNAKIKVEAIAKYYPDCFICADDSGLCVDALDGQPGIYSARFAGKDTSYQEKFTVLFNLLKEKEVKPEDWQASFKACLALYIPPTFINLATKEQIKYFFGEVQGRLTEENKAATGFGYDPIFYYPPLKKTFSDLSLAEKNKISHRGLAALALKDFLTTINL